MTKKSPILGYGFKTFPKFKGEFTETEVHESDNHNMYLYLSSQMGIPAVVLFVLILWRMGSVGIRVYRGERGELRAGGGDERRRARGGRLPRQHVRIRGWSTFVSA